MIDIYELLNLLFKLSLSIILGGIIGLERESHYKPAGFRTHLLIALASTTFTILSMSFGAGDPSRVTSSILVGMGFIGAGTIVKLRKDIVVGITTAASLWLVSAIGIAVGLEKYELAIISSFFGFLILKMKPIERMVRKK